MVVQSIDNITFEMKEAHDFSFLNKFGRVFCVFAQNDSGNISFGTDNGKDKFFIKIAGTKTAESIRSPQEAIATLKTAIPIYKDLAHSCLIQLIEHFAFDDLYVAVFKWVEGDCLFDYWNFETYVKNQVMLPQKRFQLLSCEKKLKAFDTIFDFLVFTESMGYAAVDFYDGSIIYNFQSDIVTICDIDFFRKFPIINDIGKDFWGTKRLKAPEEYIWGAKVDTVTNVFTLGALLLHFFGSYTDAEIGEMYKKSAFLPCRYETWELNQSLYRIALKAVNPNKERRYDSMVSFYEAWRAKV